jgi:Heterokaryon incompatibility protein (HET)
MDNAELDVYEESDSDDSTCHLDNTAITEIDTSTGKFQYDDEGPIYREGHAIRLLHLESGQGPIQCQLFKAFLHKTGNGMPYEALSYTWGSPKKTNRILLNGKEFMITENLHTALRYFRSRNEHAILWIDAICIYPIRSRFLCRRFWRHLPPNLAVFIATFLTESKNLLLEFGISREACT